MAADIVRPREPARQGRKVSVIMEASPLLRLLRARHREARRRRYDKRGHARPDAGVLTTNYTSFPSPATPSSVVDLAGTNRSDGCVDVGGPQRHPGPRMAVIDWLDRPRQ
ncbi:CocE/NonD family hydrolase [Streptomyces stelliscabiei]